MNGIGADFADHVANTMWVSSSSYLQLWMLSSMYRQGQSLLTDNPGTPPTPTTAPDVAPNTVPPATQTPSATGSTPAPWRLGASAPNIFG